MKHATIRALFFVWSGATTHVLPGWVPNRVRACDGSTADWLSENDILGRQIFWTVPTCPRCAVLYDEAMTAREELLGRKEAA